MAEKEKGIEMESQVGLTGGEEGGISAAALAKPNSFTYIAILVAMLGAMMFGLDQGNFGNVQGFEDFQRYWCIDRYGTEETCVGSAGATNNKWQENFVLWGACLITFGAAAGGLLVGPPIASRMGRRPCIAIGALMCVVGCVLASFASFGVVAIFMIGRFVTGFGVGVACFALPMYNSEVATPGIRGATGSLFQFNVVIGSFIATVITLFVHNWHIGIMLPAIPGVIIAFAIFVVPESPRFLMKKKGYDAGIAALRKVRSGDVTAEAKEIDETLQEEASAGAVSWGELFRGNLGKRVFIGCFLQIAQQLTGVNAFLGYASTIFGNLGITDPLLFNCIFNAVMVVGVVAGLLLLDAKAGGRRKQLMGATFLMGPALLIAGLAFIFNWPGIITMVCLCIYGLGFQLAWGMIPWIYPSEIYSMAERDRAVSLSVFWQYIFNAVIVFATPHLMGWSVGYTMLVFAALNIVNLLFVLFFIKETKGVPLEEIPALFK
uniref:LOC100127272 protein n=1 Tax=Xenopus laevis TaxID=8355 RepID=A8WH67_XENLA|nr:uncharacterized protein LOC100127272 [Xenopus laevis]AAI54994.1 LOC100127272 protein [Xenopus laevis]